MPASSGNPLRVLVCYGGIGTAYLVAPAHVTQTNAYKPALQLASHFAFGVYPMRVWGGLLCIIAVGLAYSLRNGRPAGWHWSAAMAMYWTFWVVQFAAAVVSTGGGWAAPFYALIPAWYAFERATPQRRRKR
jgi:hypothetical protein